MDYLVCHYNEIGLKGGNRRFFEEKLIKNIKRVLDAHWFEFVRRISGRIIIKLSQKGIKNSAKITDSLKKVFGIAYFVFSFNPEQRIDKITEKALEILKNKKFKSFRISTQRSKKSFFLTSQQINENIGAAIVKILSKKVRLQNPELTCFIEIVDNFAFLYLKKIRGAGGLPTTTGGKAVALLSGGIDSPVAAFEIMKRGVKIVFLHFHSAPYTDYASIEKVQEIVKILSKYQGKSRLFLAPFSHIQKEILLRTPEKLRVVLYQRMMMRIAQKLAQKENALAIVTGESIGQVASQTLENFKVIGEVADFPVFRPLIGQDKEEIIQKAKEIGTFETSILPHQDCCSRFLPKHPATKAKLKEVLKAEENLKIKELINLTISQLIVIKISGDKD